MGRIRSSLSWLGKFCHVGKGLPDSAACKSTVLEQCFMS